MYEIIYSPGDGVEEQIDRTMRREDGDKTSFGVEKRRALGMADGKYSILDNIDECNDEIAEMFGVNDG